MVFPGDTTPDLSVGGQANASLAAGPEGVSLAVWEDTRSAGHPQIPQGPAQGTLKDIYAARVRADGSVIDVTPIPIAVNSYDQWSPKAEWNGSNWLVAWRSELELDRDEEEIRAVRLSANGMVLDATPMIVGTSVADPSSSNDIDPEGPLDIVTDGANWVIQWKRYNPATFGGLGYDWFGTKVLPDGTQDSAGEKKYYSGSTSNDDFGLAFSPVNGGQYLQASNSYNNSTIRIRRFDRDLNLLTGSERVLPGQSFANQTFESIAGGPNGWALAWAQATSFNGIQAIRVNAAGDFADPAALNVSPVGSQGNFSTDITWTGNDFAIAYAAYPPDFSHADLDLFIRRLPETGTFAGPAASIIADPNHQNQPKVVGDGAGGVKMVYVDQQSSFPGVAVAVVSPANALIDRADVSLAAPSQAAADLVSDGTNFLNVFSSSTAYGTRLLAQRITPTGAALDAEPIVIDDLTDRVRSYEIIFHADRYTIFWQNFDSVIRARTVSSAGAVGPVVEVMSTAPSTGFNLDNASVNDNRVILVGNSGEGTTSLSTRFARIFDAMTLQPVTPRFLVGSTFALSGGDAEPLGNRWILAWSKKANRNSSFVTVRYAVVNADGTIFKTETQSAGNASPIIVTNGGEAATEAMVVSVDNNVRIQGSRVDGATGNLLTFQTPLIEAAGTRFGVAGTYDGTNYVLAWTDQRNYPFPAQARDDVFAARVAVNGTVLDPGGVPVADTFRPEGHPDVAVAGGQVVFVYRTFRSEAPFSSYRLAARGTNAADQTPAVLQSPPAFEFETSQGVAFEFNKPLQGVSASDLVLTNTTTGQTISPGDLRVSFVPAGGTSGWTYRFTYNAGILPDGFYRATLPAGSVLDLAGLPTVVDSVVSFHVLAGDANRDQAVNIADFSILASRFNQPGTFTQGDFNYSGTVDIGDFAILASKFNSSLPAARGVWNLSVVPTSAAPGRQVFADERVISSLGDA